MSRLSTLTKQTAEATTSGVEVQFTPDGEAMFHLTIRRGGTYNDAYQKYLEKETRPYRVAGKNFDTLAPVVQRKIVARGLALHVVTGWREDDFGQPFSVEACTQEMIDSIEFLEFVNARSNTAELFREAAIRDGSGN